MADIEAITNIEKILDGQDIEPKTRYEHFLKKSLAGSGEEKKLYVHEMTILGYTNDNNDYINCSFKFLSNNKDALTNMEKFGKTLYELGYNDSAKALSVSGASVRINLSSSNKFILARGIYADYVYNLIMSGPEIGIHSDNTIYESTQSGGQIFSKSRSRIYDTVEEVSI